MPKPRRSNRAFSDAAEFRQHIDAHKPDLDEYADTPPWQWWRGDLYLAGFRDRETAIEYGREKGWGLPPGDQ